MSTRSVTIPVFRDPDNSAASAQIRIRLVDLSGRPLLSLPLPGADPVTGEVSVTSGATEQTIDLIPQDEISPASLYAVQVNIGPVEQRYKAQVAAGAAVLTWVEFIASGEAISAPALDVWLVHPGDADLHLQGEERPALDAANTPSAANPIATIDDVVAAGGGDMHTLIYDPRGIADDTFDIAHLTGNLDGGVF